MKEWTAEYLEDVAKDLQKAAKELEEVVQEMRSKKFPTLVLQADSAFGVYRSTIMKLAGSAGSEFRDQYRCSKTGETPRWQKNQRTIELRNIKKKALSSLESESLVKPKTTKRSRKRKGTE